MKTIIPAVERYKCDITGKPILTSDNYLGATLNMDLMFFSAEYAKEIRKTYFPEEVEDAIAMEAYEVNPIELHFSEDIAIEIWTFLMKKYPESIKKYMKDHHLDGRKVVKSDWPAPKHPVEKKTKK